MTSGAIKSAVPITSGANKFGTTKPSMSIIAAVFVTGSIKTLLYESQMLDILNDSYIINSYGCFIQWINKKNKYNIYILLEYGGQNLRKILDSKNEKDIQSVIQNLPKLLETLKNLHKNNIQS